MESATRVADLAEQLGADEVGRRYIARLASTVFSASVRNEVGEGSGDQLDEAVYQAVWLGEESDGRPLPVELRWDVTMATLRACPDDDGLLWCLGDGPFDHMLNVPELRRRLSTGRGADLYVDRLVGAMQRTLPGEGVTDGWWFDGGSV